MLKKCFVITESDNPNRPSGIAPMISDTIPIYDVADWSNNSSRTSGELVVVRMDVSIEISGSQLDNNATDVIVYAELSDKGQELYNELYPMQELPYWIKSFDDEAEAESLANEVYDFAKSLDNSAFDVNNSPFDYLADFLREKQFGTEMP